MRTMRNVNAYRRACVRRLHHSPIALPEMIGFSEERADRLIDDGVHHDDLVMEPILGREARWKLMEIADRGLTPDDAVRWGWRERSQQSACGNRRCTSYKTSRGSASPDAALTMATAALLC